MGTIARKSAAFVATTYIDIWEAAIGEELNCKREPSNSIRRGGCEGRLQLSVRQASPSENIPVFITHKRNEQP